MISFSKETLREALNGLRVLKLPKQVLPACQHVLVQGFASVAWFDGTDLDQYLRYEGAGANTGATRLLVPYEVLANAAKQADATGEICLFDGPEPFIVYSVAGSPMSVPFSLLDVADFPPKPTPAGEAIPLPAGVIGAMREALGCASADQNRYILNGVYLDAHAVVATDARQLYRRNSLDLPLPKGLLFPRSGVPGILPDSEAALLVWTEHNRELAQISAGRWRWITKLIDGNFPNYAQVIPRPDSYGTMVHLAEADVARLQSVVPKLPGFKAPDSIVVLSISEDKGAVLRTAPQQPKVHVALDRSDVVCPAPIEIGFNARYLLGALETGMRELRVRDPMSPLLLLDESRLQMWMPYGLGNASPAPVATAPVEPLPAATENSDPSGESPAPVVPTESTPAAPDPAPEPVTPVSTTHHETHQPNDSIMVAPASTPSQPASETREGTAPGAVASRIPAAPAPAVSIVDAINARLGRLRDLLREAGTEFANIQTLVKEHQRSYRTLERDHEALKKNIRALREVPV